MKKLLVVLLALLVLTGCSSSSDDAAKYVAGEYTGVGKGMYPDVTVKVVVDEAKIISVEVTTHAETEDVSAPAIAAIPTAIVEAQSTEVDVVSNATMTSNGIIEAVNNALAEAATK